MVTVLDTGAGFSDSVCCMAVVVGTEVVTARCSGDGSRIAVFGEAEDTVTVGTGGEITVVTSEVVFRAKDNVSCSTS